MLPRLTRLARALGLSSLEGASAGLCVWGIASHGVLAAYGRTNELPAEDRRLALASIVAGAVVALVLASLLRRTWRADVAVLERVARRLSLLLVVGLAPFLFCRRLWFDRDAVALSLVAVFSFGLSQGVRIAMETPPAFPTFWSWKTGMGGWLAHATARAVESARRVSPMAVVVLAAVLYGAYFSVASIIHHQNLGTASFDLGLEDNLLWHTVHGGLPLFRSTPFGGPNVTHFGNHATFFAYVIAPLYALAPRAETLLVVQAFLMGGAAIPLYLYASRHLPKWTSVLVALAYLAYPPLHGANLYDFHYLPLGVLFLWLTLYAVEANKRALAVTSIVLALSVREDVAACLSVVGLFLLLRGTAPRAGAAIAAIGGASFLLLKMVIMPMVSGGDASFLNQYEGLLPEGEHSYAGVLKTALANPAFTANIVLTQDKVTYLLEVFTPLFFLPLRRPIAFLLVAPGFFFTLLATHYLPLNLPSFQYTTYWTAFAFIGVVVTLEHAAEARHAGDSSGPIRVRALSIGLAVSILTCTFLDGAILHRTDVRGGFGRFDLTTSEIDAENRRNLAVLIAEIPPDAKVVASERLVPHLSNRDFAYSLRHATFDADWLLFESPLHDGEREHCSTALREEGFGVVDVRGTMALAKRGAPTERNDGVLRQL
jgi:uncharacterized membrane protein